MISVSPVITTVFPASGVFSVCSSRISIKHLLKQQFLGNPAILFVLRKTHGLFPLQSHRIHPLPADLPLWHCGWHSKSCRYSSGRTCLVKSRAPAVPTSGDSQGRESGHANPRPVRMLYRLRFSSLSADFSSEAVHHRTIAVPYRLCKPVKIRSNLPIETCGQYSSIQRRLR